MDQLELKGQYKIDLVRDGKVIDTFTADNAITTEGKSHNLDVVFASGTQIGAWYVGLVDTVGYTALSSADTYANINQVGNGWDEFSDYTDTNNSGDATTRPQWANLAVTAGSITNASVKAVYDITVAGTVKGLFIAGGPNSQLKDNNSGGNVLWSSALFNSGDVSVVGGDQLKVTYTLSA